MQKTVVLQKEKINTFDELITQIGEKVDKLNQENEDLNKKINELNSKTQDLNMADIIKANILDFSLEHNKDNNDIYKNKYYFHQDKDYQESVGDINLSFSIDDVNTFKCKEK